MKASRRFNPPPNRILRDALQRVKLPTKSSVQVPQTSKVRIGVDPARNFVVVLGHALEPEWLKRHDAVTENLFTWYKTCQGEERQTLRTELTTFVEGLYRRQGVTRKPFTGLLVKILIEEQAWEVTGVSRKDFFQSMQTRLHGIAWENGFNLTMHAWPKILIEEVGENKSLSQAATGESTHIGSYPRMGGLIHRRIKSIEAKEAKEARKRHHGVVSSKQSRPHEAPVKPLERKGFYFDAKAPISTLFEGDEGMEKAFEHLLAVKVGNLELEGVEPCMWIPIHVAMMNEMIRHLSEEVAKSRFITLRDQCGEIPRKVAERLGLMRDEQFSEHAQELMRRGEKLFAFARADERRAQHSTLLKGYQERIELTELARTHAQAQAEAQRKEAQRREQMYAWRGGRFQKPTEVVRTEGRKTNDPTLSRMAKGRRLSETPNINPERRAKMERKRTLKRKGAKKRSGSRK